MAEIKTKPTTQDVEKYLNTIKPEDKRKDGLELKKLFDSVTKEKAVLWSNGMIAYGTYHYKSEKSSQEGYWPLTAFSVRKQNLTVYLMAGMGGADKYKEILAKLGKYKISSGSCLYINKLEDIDLKILKKLIETSFKDVKKKHSK